jgi:biopolymer transport protein ExbD
MAGSTDDGENPVPLNVTPLIDIIFCLIIFFMCSFHFKQVEGKFDSWLPKEGGVHPTPVKAPVVLDEVRVILAFDEVARAVVTRLGARAVESESELRELLAEARRDFAALGRAEPPVILDAAARVPWAAVVRAMDVCRAADFSKIEFAAPLAAVR